MKVVLELQDQPSNVRRVTVRHDIVIGRGSDCNLRLSAPQVSRRHCFLRVGREGVSITDLDSSNGTFVEGKRIKPGARIELASGTALSVGPIRFVVHIRDEAVSSDVLQSGSLSALAAAQDASVGIGATGKSVPTRDKAADSMDFSLETNGPSKEEHEPTEQMDDANAAQQAMVIPPRRKRSDLLDSRAEVIDLGKQIAELDAERAIADADTIRPGAANAHAVQETAGASAEAMIYEDVEVLEVVDDDVVDVDNVDIVSLSDVHPPLLNRSTEMPVHPSQGFATTELAGKEAADHLSDEQLLDAEFLAEELEEAEDVEELDEVMELVDEECEVIDEPLAESDLVPGDDEITEFVDASDVQQVEASSDSGSSWFSDDSADKGNDEIDPDLQKFLKGF